MFKLLDNFIAMVPSIIDMDCYNSADQHSRSSPASPHGSSYMASTYAARRLNSGRLIDQDYTVAKYFVFAKISFNASLYF